MDETAIHWVSFDTNGKIIASARLAIITDIHELPYPQIFTNVEPPSERPFLFYSRLVIHPRFRKLGLKEKFDRVRLHYQMENQFAFSVATATFLRTQELLRFGWKNLGEVTDDMDKAFPFVKERSLLILLRDIKLPAEDFVEKNEDFYVCGFQRGMMMEGENAETCTK